MDNETYVSKGLGSQYNGKLGKKATKQTWGAWRGCKEDEIGDVAWVSLDNVLLYKIVCPL